MHRIIRLRTAGLLLTVPLVLTGCSGGKDEETPDVPGTVQDGGDDQQDDQDQDEDEDEADEDEDDS